mmetsp:Transcript_14689/g.16652  ORF Transcript_14689/g.16652 Transcript_14689/m.16652 type:complete len:143 (+) Transcript_14689:1189-1617(+)
MHQRYDQKHPKANKNTRESSRSEKKKKLKYQYCMQHGLTFEIFVISFPMYIPHKKEQLYWYAYARDKNSEVEIETYRLWMIRRPKQRRAIRSINDHVIPKRIEFSMTMGFELLARNKHILTALSLAFTLEISFALSISSVSW